MVVSLKPYFPYLNYALNKDYISQFLCINKDKPDLECNGKCHLKSQIKKLNQEDNQDYPNPLSNKKVKNTLFIQSIFKEYLFCLKIEKTEFPFSFFSSPDVVPPTPPPKFSFS
jgi:hypothetical protein